MKPLEHNLEANGDRLEMTQKQLVIIENHEANGESTKTDWKSIRNQ